MTLASYPWIAASLRCFGYAGTRRAVSRWVGPRPLRWAGETRELADVVMRVTGRLAPDNGCLPRALTLCHVLAWHGIAGDVRFGALTRGGRLAAHAWVEAQGLRFGDQPGTYAPLGAS